MSALFTSFKKRQNVYGIGLLLLVCLATGGCSRFFSGGGWLNSSVSGKKVTFGFIYKETAEAKMHGVYHDHGVGVHFRFVGPQTWKIFGSDPASFGVGYVYESLDPRNPGTGSVIVWGTDRGERGMSKGDEFNVNVESGPYAGYSLSGDLQGGNLQNLEKS